jgi:hypothetical protein
LNAQCGLDTIRVEAMLRKLIACGLVCLLSSPIFAQESAGTAVLYGTGQVYLNGSQLTNSASVASGDVIQTRESAAANLSAPGSSLVIQSNTIVRFQGSGLALDRGSVSVATGRGMSVFARDFKISPVSSDWTEFYVTRASGAIQILARKNSVTVTCGANTSLLKQGEQMSRDDAADCGIAQKHGPGAPSAAKGPLLSSPVADWAAIGAGSALLIWTFTRQEDAVSPSKP